MNSVNDRRIPPTTGQFMKIITNSKLWLKVIGNRLTKPRIIFCSHYMMKQHWLEYLKKILNIYDGVVERAGWSFELVHSYINLWIRIPPRSGSDFFRGFFRARVPWRERTSHSTSSTHMHTLTQWAHP